MNKQPFYHRVDGILFTCTQSLDEEEFKGALEKALKSLHVGYVKGSLEIEFGGWVEPEPGDPADLMD